MWDLPAGTAPVIEKVCVCRSVTAWLLGKRSGLSCGFSVPSGSRRPWDRGWPACYLLCLKGIPVRREQLKPGEYGVFAVQAGRQRCWHPPCFACQTCGQALINLIYFYHDGHLYCGRHHAELLRPRCPACDQLIFSQHCTEAEGQRWHENHFCCQDCAGPLGGGSYALPGGSPCCPSCFESRYSDADTSPAGALEGRVSLGPDGTGTHGRASSEDATVSRAALPASRRRDTRGVREQEPAEDAPCPTCSSSSSSDSEPEGFFLGQRLPGPGPAPGRRRAEDGDPFRKRCTVC
ncbi:prickle-like protein 4 isoform X2 [Dipodomys merriami]|uniref:prickle-like protein 4 isoform X2 n=1 Tax=Dipodomys merriami TaxID=94247 RepID=UPI003855A9FF